MTRKPDDVTTPLPDDTNALKDVTDKPGFERPTGVCGCTWNGRKRTYNPNCSQHDS